MGTLKKHWSNEPPGLYGVYSPICGTPCSSTQIAKRIEDVDCELCKAKLAQEPPDTVAEYVEEKFEPRPLTEYTRRQWKVTEPCFDDPDGFPFIRTREAWRMFQRCNGFGPVCDHCDLCRFYRDIDSLPSDHDAYLPRRIRHGEPSIDIALVDHALQWYADHVDIGRAAKSSWHWVTRLEGIEPPARGEHIETYRMQALALLSVSHGAKHDETPTLAAAVRRERIEWVLARMFRSDTFEDVGRAACFAIMFERVVGRQQDTRIGPRRFPVSAEKVAESHGLTAGRVGAILRAGRQDFLRGVEALEEHHSKQRRAREHRGAA